MGRYQAYPEYKSSGEEWLGDVPNHWDVVKIKHLSPVKRGASPRPIDDPKYFDDEGDYAWVRIADVSSSDTYLKTSTQQMSVLGSSLSVKLEPGELFLSIAGTVGKPCITAIRACIHDGFVYFPDLKIPNKFLFYVFAGEQAYKGLGKFGTQLNLNTDTVGDIKVGMPSYGDAEKIINFLDHETAKIDTLIEKQQQLIQLLKEKRQAVISHAVTKGLNPNAPMKDSGVEWLGEVPVEWSVVPIKRVCEVKDGTHDTPQYVDPSDETFPLITSKDFDGDNISFSNAKYISKEDHDEIIKRSNTEVGDVLMSMIGGNIGKALIVKNHADFSIKNVALFKTSGCEVLAKYILYYLQSGLLDVQISLLSRGGAQGFLSLSDLRNLVFFKVPRQELEEIIAFLNNNVTNFDNLIIKAESTIGIMQERRTALISAAVTGKIDVRNFSAQLT